MEVAAFMGLLTYLHSHVSAPAGFGQYVVIDSLPIITICVLMAALRRKLPLGNPIRSGDYRPGAVLR